MEGPWIVLEETVKNILIFHDHLRNEKHSRYAPVFGRSQITPSKGKWHTYKDISAAIMQSKNAFGN